MFTLEEISFAALVSTTTVTSRSRAANAYLFGLLNPVGFKFNLFVHFV
jgi:hypothetical protein